MSLRKKQNEFTRALIEFISILNFKGYEVSIGEVYRTEYQQREYIRIGWSRVNYSNHQSKTAADLYFWINDVFVEDAKTLKEIGMIWKSLNKLHKWGGDFKNFYDPHHFEFYPF